jgi:4-hydroxybenzoate polyprenyltransferase
LTRGKSRVTIFISVAFAVMLLANATPGIALPRLAALLMAICAVAAYGHVINDIFDIEEDRRAGKPNTMAGRTPLARAAFALAFVTVSLAVPALAGVTAVGLILIAANLLLPTLYSLPGIRLKERGVLGVLADAGAAHALPALLFGTAFWPAPVPASVVVATIAAATFSFIAGLRGIIVHQVHDRPTDSRAGVRTFAIAEGVEQSRRIVMRGLLPFEVVALVAFLTVVLPAAPVAAAVLVLHAVLEALKMRSGWRLPLFYPEQPTRERYLPLLGNESYEVWLPLALSAQLATRPWGFALLPPVVVLLFWQNLGTRLRALATLRPGRASRRPAAAGADHLDRPPVAASELNIVLGATYWTLNGVNVFSMNLARGLQAAGARVRILACT